MLDVLIRIHKEKIDEERTAESYARYKKTNDKFLYQEWTKITGEPIIDIMPFEELTQEEFEKRLKEDLEQKI